MKNKLIRIRDMAVKVRVRRAQHLDLKKLKEE